MWWMCGGAYLHTHIHACNEIVLIFCLIIYSTPKTNTVHSIFRRAGLVPRDSNDWDKAWKGKSAFVYVQSKPLSN